jgi:hypothetical protein
MSMCKTLFFLSSLTVCSRLCFKTKLPSLSKASKNCKPSFYFIFSFSSSFGRKSRTVRDLPSANRNRGDNLCFFGLWVGPPRRRDHPTLKKQVHACMDIVYVLLVSSVLPCASALMGPRQC